MTVRCWVFVLLVALAGCGPKSLDAKMKDADKLSDRIGGLLDLAERSIGEAKPKEAEDALAEAAKLLAEPDMNYSPEREMYASRHAEIAPRLNEAREARKQKDIEEAVVNERAEIGPSLQAMKDGAEAITGPKVDEKLIEAARDSVTALEKAVGASDERRLFALKDPSFLGYLKRAKAETEKARAVVTKAEKKLKFLKGPVMLKQKATDELKQSKSEKDAAKKRALVSSAAQGYGRCVSAGVEFTKGGLAAEKVTIGASTTTVESFLETCKAAQQSTDQALAKLPKAKPAAKKKK
jgi:hypothetical protein